MISPTMTEKRCRERDKTIAMYIRCQLRQDPSILLPVGSIWAEEIPKGFNHEGEIPEERYDSQPRPEGP